MTPFAFLKPASQLAGKFFERIELRDSRLWEETPMLVASLFTHTCDVSGETIPRLALSLSQMSKRIVRNKPYHDSELTVVISINTITVNHRNAFDDSSSLVTDDVSRLNASLVYLIIPGCNITHRFLLNSTTRWTNH